MKFNYRLFVLLIFAAVAVVSSACATTEAVTSTRQVELAFVTHLAAEMPEQDVFVEVEPGSDQVRRLILDDGQAYNDTPVYAAQEKIAHDPFQLGNNPVGPYPQGADLGFTMGEWLAGTGSGTYTIDGDQAEIEIQFEKLVPNGVYTLWCAHINVPPHFTIVDEPCGVQDGSQNRMVADANGQASFKLTLDKLPDTTEETVRVIAAAYHSDGETYGFYPGDFGLNTHVQILAFLPAPDDTAWQTVSEAGSLAER